MPSKLPNLVAAGATFTALSIMSAPAYAANFTGPYAPANFTLVNRNADGLVDTAGTPSSIKIIGGNNGNNSFGTTDYIGQAADSGLLRFNWSYLTQDVAGFFDPFSFVINGNPVAIFSGLSNQSQGSFSTNIKTGDLFSFRIATTENNFGRGTVAISNFSIGETTAIPTPALLPGLIGLGVGVLRQQRLKEALVSTDEV